MPDRDTIRQTLLQIIEGDLDRTFGNLDDHANLRQELGLDSVDLVGVVMQIENHFRIRLSHEELQKVVAVGDLLDLIQAKTAESAGPAAA
jgi:acyl carrier protein